MGKYKEFDSYGDHDLSPEYQGKLIADSLLNISNELAEANRLKIIELEMYKITYGIEEKFDLEDKA